MSNFLTYLFELLSLVALKLLSLFLSLYKFYYSNANAIIDSACYRSCTIPSIMIRFFNHAKVDIRADEQQTRIGVDPDGGITFANRFKMMCQLA